MEKKIKYSIAYRRPANRSAIYCLVLSLVLFISLTAQGQDQKRNGKFGDSTLIIISAKHFDLYILGGKKISSFRAEQRLNASDSSYPYVKTIKLISGKSLIVRKDSSIIYCNTIDETDIALSYKEDENRKKGRQVISKKDVLKYYNSEYADQPMQDTTKSIIPYINYSALKLVRGDTVHINKYNEYEFRHSALSLGELKDLLSNNPVAYAKIKKARRQQHWGTAIITVCSITALAMLRVPGSTESRTIIGAGAVVAGGVIATPLIIAYKKNVRRAIGLFNEKYR